MKITDISQLKVGQHFQLEIKSMKNRHYRYNNGDAYHCIVKEMGLNVINFEYYHEKAMNKGELLNLTLEYYTINESIRKNKWRVTSIDILPENLFTMDEL